MSVALVDTTLLLHLYRRYPPALEWYARQTERLSITSINWMEMMTGVSSKASQKDSLTLLNQFEMLYIIPADQDWAMAQLERFQFSHHIGMNDCLIAAAAQRLQLPLYTHNLKDMQPLLGYLASQPYD